MSLNFSDDEDTYEHKVAEEQENKEEWGEAHFRDETENDFGAAAVEEDVGPAEAEEKKKKKTSLGFHLQNVFNDVALKRIHRYIKRKRKSECLEKGEEFFDDEQDEDDSANVEGEDDEEGDLERYVREEQKRLAQMVPEKDEFWEMYIYLNLKKKKRKIEYDPAYYSNAFKKILESAKKDYIKIVEEYLFKNEKLKEYFVTTDVTDILKNLPNNIFHIEKFLKARVIKKCYTLGEINRRLTDLFNKGSFCNYIKEVNVYNENTHTGNFEGEGQWNESNNNNNNNNIKGADEQKEKENEFQRSLSTSVIRERENVNMLLKNMYDKYVDIISKIKRHQRSELRSNFNLFMNLINEVTSKLYFNIHNVLETSETVKLADIYKTIRRKYNIHNVLSKIQKLTLKKEVYEVYRSYLLYKYKTTHDMCEETFKNHMMQDGVNVFNFKKFYNTDFSPDIKSIIKTLKENDSEEEQEQEEETYEMEREKEAEKGLKGEFNKQKKYPVDESYKKDVYTDDFFNIDKGEGWDGKSVKTHLYKVEATNADVHASAKYETKEQNDNSVVAQPKVKPVDAAKTEKTAEKEETPLERAKRIAREKKKMLLEAKSKII